MQKIRYLIIGIIVITLLIIAVSYIITQRSDQLRQNQVSGTQDQILDKQDQVPGTKEVATELTTPWDLEFLPDGKMILTERSGHAFLFSDNVKKDLGFIKGTVQRGEGGLLGLAVDPDFTLNRRVYFYYTYLRGNELRNGVVRYVLNTEDQLVDEVHLIDTIPAASNHNGGGLDFGPDGKLYITTGDASNAALAQITNSLAGKILRINTDGSLPEDNPFGNAVWAYGLRNPQGLAWHATNGLLYTTEHGPSAMDEINIIERGKNYGWPAFQCDRRTGGQEVENVEPIACFSEFTLAPSGISQLNNALFVGGLRGQQLRKLSLSADGRTVADQEIIFSGYGRIRAVAERDGRIYFSTSNKDGRGVPANSDDKIIEYIPGN